MNAVVLSSLKKRTCLFVAMCVALFATTFHSSNAAYVNIGTRSRSALVNKVYVGFDTRFVDYRFGKGEKKDMIYN